MAFGCELSRASLRHGAFFICRYAVPFVFSAKYGIRSVNYVIQAELITISTGAATFKVSPLLKV